MHSSTGAGGAAAGLGTVLRVAAAVAVLVSGLVHLQLYFDGYRDFPDANLGRSFLLNAIASAVLAAALVWRREVVVRITAMVLLAGTLAAFVLSRTDRGVFGFTERGFEPSPQVALALIAEIVGLGLLVVSLFPAIGSGVTLPPAAGGAAVGVVAVIAIASGAFFARSDAPGTVTSGPAPTTTTTTTTAAAPPTTGRPQTPATTAPPGGSTEPTASAPPGGPPASSAPPATSAPTGKVVVSIADFAFHEATIDVPVGTTVEWVNDDSFAHSVVADDGSFTSEELASGDGFSFTFTTAGAFPYACGIHPSMVATVNVTG